MNEGRNAALGAALRLVRDRRGPIIALPPHGAARRNAIAQVHGFTPKRRAFKSLVALLGVLPLDRLWTVSLASDDKLIALVAALLDRLEALLSRPVAALSIAWPWPPGSPRGRVYVSLYDADGAPLAFAKLATAADQNSGLENEARLLPAIDRATSPGIGVPRLIDAGLIDGLAYVASTPLPLSARVLRGSEMAALANLATITPTPVRTSFSALQAMPWWPAFLSALEAEPGGDVLLARLHVEGLATTLVHGDFGAKNAMEADGRLWIVDWERGAVAGPALTDALSVRLRAGLHEGHFATAASAQAWLAANAFDPPAQLLDLQAAFAYLLAVDCADAAAAAAIWSFGTA